MANDCPVVFAHGIFGFGPKELGRLRYWGPAFKVPEVQPRYEASVGPLSSAHDRACELAAQIIGARVDYGEQHADREKHHRWGDDFSGEGFHPDWSENRPVHLVGHSLGSPTVRCLQHLLAVDYWGWGSNERWVKSITTLSGVSNGSTLTYFFGADERTGLPTEAGLGTLMVRLIDFLSGVTRGLLDEIYDFDLGHWGFHRRSGESLLSYLHRVAASDFFRGKDNALYSLTLQGAYHDNAAWPTFPDTWYFSYITEQTHYDWLARCHKPSFLMNPAMRIMSRYIGAKVFDQAPIPLSGFRSSDWWENDGAVSTVSQRYPFTNGSHPVGGECTRRTQPSEFEKGKWYFQWEHEMDHLDICLAPQLSQYFRLQRFYTDLYQRLAAL